MGTLFSVVNTAYTAYTAYTGRIQRSVERNIIEHLDVTPCDTISLTRVLQFIERTYLIK